jgi:hypothetical protein
MAQNQYEPLGLLSTYKVRLQLLMRKVTLKGKIGGWRAPWIWSRRKNSGFFLET